MRKELFFLSVVGSKYFGNRFFLDRTQHEIKRSLTQLGSAPPPGIPSPLGHPNVNLSTSSTLKHRRNSDENAVFFLTAASRGLGIELTRQLLNRTKGHIIASCRDPSKATELQSLSRSHHGRLTILTLDITNQLQIQQVSEFIVSHHNGRLDGLFNVAGVLGDGTSTPGPERSISAIQRDWMMKSMEINCIGPILLIQALSPYMRVNGKDRAPTVICNFSARVGSISDNRLGGWYSYRISKSALNQATKCTALELKRYRTWVFSYHPGTTDTDLSRPFQANVNPEKLFTPAFTVSRVLDICDGIDERHTGGFYDYSGTFVLW